MQAKLVPFKTQLHGNYIEFQFTLVQEEFATYSVVATYRTHRDKGLLTIKMFHGSGEQVSVPLDIVPLIREHLDLRCFGKVEKIDLDVVIGLSAKFSEL